MGPQFPQVPSHLPDQRHSDGPPKLQGFYVLSNCLALLFGEVLEPSSDRFATRVEPKESDTNRSINRHSRNVPQMVHMSRGVFDSLSCLTSALSGPRYSPIRRSRRHNCPGACGAHCQSFHGPLQRIVRRHFLVASTRRNMYWPRRCWTVTNRHESARSSVALQDISSAVVRRPLSQGPSCSNNRMAPSGERFAVPWFLHVVGEEPEKILGW